MTISEPVREYNNMQIQSHSTSNVITETYIVSTPEGSVTYTEYLNDKGKVIDCNLRTEDGENIDDPALLEEIQQLIDDEPEEQRRRDEKHGLFGDKEDIAN